MVTPANALAAFVRTHYAEGRGFCIALSGGLDSHVLLHLAARLRDSVPFPLSLRAVHVHHGMHPLASAWAMQCATMAHALGIDFHCEKMDFATLPQKNIEETLRDARYQLFKKILQPDEIVLTAHHQQDQAETVLLQLLRGAGPKGLAAMPLFKAFGIGWHGRPLLSVSRAQLMDYATAHQLQWIDDTSNQNLHYTRNFIRHTILPLLAERQPAVFKNLARVAENCARETALLAECLEIENYFGSFENTLSVDKLKKISFLKACQVVRFFILSKKIKVPTQKKLNQIVQTVLSAAPDKNPVIAFGAAQIRRYRDDIYLFANGSYDFLNNPHNQKNNKIINISWDGCTPLIIESIGQWPPLFTTPQTNLSVRFRQGGEKVWCKQRKQHVALKNLLQEKGIPPWERARIPLLFRDNVLEAVLWPESNK